MNSDPPPFEDQIDAVAGEDGEGMKMVVFRERTCPFSLKSRAIRPSEFVGTRRKVALRSEAYAWAPVLRSFCKTREIPIYGKMAKIVISVTKL